MIGSAGGTGLSVLNGEIQYGIINLVVIGPLNGIGVDLSSASNSAIINNNQISKLFPFAGLMLKATFNGAKRQSIYQAHGGPKRMIAHTF